MATPVKKNLTIYKGGLFQHRFKYMTPDGVPVPLAGWTAQMQVREDYDSVAVLSLSSVNGTLALDGEQGTVDINIPAASTATLPISSGVYDLELTMPDTVTVIKLAVGKVTVVEEVTR